MAHRYRAGERLVVVFVKRRKELEIGLVSALAEDKDGLLQ
jgi:hypothetical protein